MLLFSLSTTNQNIADNSQALEKYLSDIANGNKTALDAIYRLTSKAVFGFSLSILKNFHDAEDVLQEVYIKIWNNACNYQQRLKPMAWILTITKNLSISKIRANAKIVDLEHLDLENSPLNSESINTEDRIFIEALLNRLSDIERQIIVLHSVSGLKHKEVSDILDIPLSTVLSKYNRAIKKLKAVTEVE